MSSGSFEYADIRPYFDAVVGQLMELPEVAGDHGVVVGLTSANYGEGVSTIAGTLAFGLRESQVEPLLLLDANLWRPGQHMMFGTPGEPGLADLLLGQENDQLFFGTATNPPFQIMPAGNFPRQVPRGVFLSKKIPKLITYLRNRFRFVLVDVPPLAASGSVVQFCSLMDAVILVVEAEQTRREVVEAAKDALEGAGVNILGAIFNKRHFHIPDWLYRRL